VVSVRQERHLALEPMAALAAALAAAGDAGRYAGGGVRTVGRRFARTRFSRSASASARESRRRAALAVRILRGFEPPVPPRPTRRRADYVMLGFVVGTTGAAVAGAVRRAVANVDHNRPWTAQMRGIAGAVRGARTPAASGGTPEEQPAGTAPGGSGTTA
jgi:hypothetical protein